MTFEVQQTDQFKADLEEALLWLYSHNFEQSQEFADRKFLELQQEIEDIEKHLAQMPHMGQPSDVSELGRFPVYGGRYSVTWFVENERKIVTLTEFNDSKYPKTLREFQLEE